MTSDYYEERGARRGLGGVRDGAARDCVLRILFSSVIHPPNLRKKNPETFSFARLTVPYSKFPSRLVMRLVSFDPQRPHQHAMTQKCPTSPS